MIDEAIVARAETAARVVAPLAERAERERRLPAESVRALTEAGIFKLMVPRAYGGAEAPVATQIAAFEAIARADGAAGWCAMIGATSGLVAAFVPPEVAREVFEPDEVALAGVFAPMGRARPAGDEWTLRGRWSFCSGCEHAQWIMAGALVEPVDPARPQPVSLLLRREQCEIVDTWDTSGLRGTGSHDFTVADATVPRARVFSLFAPPLVDAPLYRQPFFGTLAAGVAAVALGIARAALAEFAALAASKQPPGARRTLAHRELAQLAAARAEGALSAARAGLHAAVEAAAAEVEATGAASQRARAVLRAAACHAAAESARAVDLVYEAAGGSAIYARSPLQRQFRDVHVVTQHVMVAGTSAVAAGRVLLGLEAEAGTL
jgi:alkylation response protein AidB-like acyl-CoA dehydrogenase